MGRIKRVAVIVVLLLMGLTGMAHGTPYSACTLSPVPALQVINDIHCFGLDGSTGLTSGRADLAAAARAISYTTGIFSVPHSGLQPCFSLPDGAHSGAAALLDIGIPMPALFPPAFLLLTPGFAGLGFVPKKALRRTATSHAARLYRFTHLPPAGPSFETLSRCFRK